MARDRVALNTSQPAAMNCADVRPWFPAHRSGQIALTEGALVEAHLRLCARCRLEEARHREGVGQRPAPRPHPALFATRGWALLKTAATEVTSRVVFGPMQAVSLGAGHGARLIARLYSMRTIAPGLLARTTAGWSRGRRPQAGSAVPCRPDPGVRPAPPVTRPPATAVKPRGFARACAAAMPRAGSPPPVPAPGPAVAAPHVVGRLSTKDRDAAEHALTALLTEVHGARLDRTEHARFTSVEVIVPHAGYRTFTHGLGRLGSWRLEATTFSLPDAIRIAIRVSE
jgi:hypothetical protein